MSNNQPTGKHQRPSHHPRSSSPSYGLSANHPASLIPRIPQPHNPALLFLLNQRVSYEMVSYIAEVAHASIVVHTSPSAPTGVSAILGAKATMLAPQLPSPPITPTKPTSKKDGAPPPTQAVT